MWERQCLQHLKKKELIETNTQELDNGTTSPATLKEAPNFVKGGEATESKCIEKALKNKEQKNDEDWTFPEDDSEIPCFDDRWINGKKIKIEYTELVEPDGGFTSYLLDESVKKDAIFESDPTSHLFNNFEQNPQTNQFEEMQDWYSVEALRDACISELKKYPGVLGRTLHNIQNAIDPRKEIEFATSATARQTVHQLISQMEKWKSSADISDTLLPTGVNMKNLKQQLYEDYHKWDVIRTASEYGYRRLEHASKDPVLETFTRKDLNSVRILHQNHWQQSIRPQPAYTDECFARELLKHEGLKLEDLNTEQLAERRDYYEDAFWYTRFDYENGAYLDTLNPILQSKRS